MNFKNRKNRVEKRSDLSMHLTHFTRATESKNALEVLLKILEDKKLIGSTTKTGYIVGDIPAVCFQESPLEVLTENILYENKSLDCIERIDVRYSGVGIRFIKDYVFKKG